MVTEAQATCVLARSPAIGNYVYATYPVTWQNGGKVAILDAWFQDSLRQGTGSGPYAQALAAGSDLDQWVRMFYGDCLLAVQTSSGVVSAQVLRRVQSGQPEPVTGAIDRAAAWAKANPVLAGLGALSVLLLPSLLGGGRRGRR